MVIIIYDDRYLLIVLTIQKDSHRVTVFSNLTTYTTANVSN